MQGGWPSMHRVQDGNEGFFVALEASLPNHSGLKH
jgi:hypothetical protein